MGHAAGRAGAGEMLAQPLGETGGAEMLGPRAAAGGRGSGTLGLAAMGRTGGQRHGAPGRHGEDWGTVTLQTGEPPVCWENRLLNEKRNGRAVSSSHCHPHSDG